VDRLVITLCQALLYIVISCQLELIFLSNEGGQDLSVHTSFTMYGCKLLIRIDTSIIDIDIPPPKGWTGLVRLARPGKDLMRSPSGGFAYLSSIDH